MKREENLKLFQDREKNWITYGDLVRAMKEVKADDCDALLIHTDLSFGLPTRELKRKELVEVLYDAICELGVKTLIFPTFTFSYGNREDFDVKNTKCKMGMLNEYVRKMPESVRSKDPLMSVCVIGENKELAKVSGNKSLGEGSFFDRFHHTKNTRIMFFGAQLPQCHTQMHYVEEKLRVPYRYDMKFEGNIIDENGVSTPAEPISGLTLPFVAAHISLPNRTPPAVPRQNAIRPRRIIFSVFNCKKTLPVAVAPTVTPRKIVTIFISSF